MENNNTQPKSKSRKRFFLIGLGLIATGVLSIFGINYWRKNKQTTKQADPAVPDLKTQPKLSKPKAPTHRTAASKQSKTTKTQEPPKQAATAPPSKPINAGLVAKGFYAAIIAKNFKTVLLLLKTMHGTQDYADVSKAFGKLRVNGVHKTLVNGLLDNFKDDAQKKAIQSAFTDMGLKYDGKKWSLSGTNEKPMLITSRSTTVWKNPKNSVKVPDKMVLGKEIDKRGNFTVFENEGQFFLVQSAHTETYNR